MTVAKSKQTRQRLTKRTPQFEQVARELGCPEDETAFEATLKQIVDAGPVPKHQPKKRQAKGAPK